MNTTVAFEAQQESQAEDARWRQVSPAPHVLSSGGYDMVVEEEGLRAFVNGLPVIGGMQVIQPGDLVRITGSGQERFFQYAGARTDTREEGGGRPCAFTGIPIPGVAVKCGACERVVSEAVATQVGACVCGRSLKAGDQTAPGEELL